MHFRGFATLYFLIAGVTAMPALAEDVSIGVENLSSSDLVEFFASPVGNDNWGGNVLGAAPIAAGATVAVTIRETRGCEYDLRMVFADGDVLEDKSDICVAATYTIH